MSADGNGNTPQVQAPWPPVELASVGTMTGPDAKQYVVLTFSDTQGQRAHFFDGPAAKKIGKELARLSGFVGAGLHLPPNGVGPRPQ